MNFEELALMGGSRLLNPVPISLVEREVVYSRGGLIERGVIYVFTLGSRLRRALYLREPLYIVYTGVEPGKVVPLARSMVLSLLAAEGMGEEPYEPILVVLDRELGPDALAMVAEELRVAYGRGRVVSDYRGSRLARLLGHVLDASPQGSGLRVRCGDESLCRVCLLPLSRSTRVESIAIGSRVVMGEDVESIIVGLPVSGGGSGGANGFSECIVEGGYLVLRGDCIFSRLYTVLAGRGPSLGSFPVRVGLDECASLVVLGFKRLGDVVRDWRVV